MGCEGCLISNKGPQEALQSIISEAQQYGKENKKTMVIYQEGHELRYIDAETAFRDNYPIVQVVSKHQ